MRINSPKCSFVKVARRFYFTNFITKFTAISHAKYRNGLCTGLLSSGCLLFGTCRQNSTVEWLWMEFFSARSSCISASFIFAADKFVTNGVRLETAITDCVKRWIDIQGMQHVDLTHVNGHICLGTLPIVLQFIFILFHFMVCNCLFAKNIRSDSDIGKNVSWKNLILSRKLSSQSSALGSLCCYQIA